MKVIENGRDQSVPLVPAKLEAYKALACSASTPVTIPNGVLVVEDCVTKFFDDYILLDDSIGDEPHMEYITGGEVELVDSDGYGLILPALAERWSNELGSEEMYSGLCIRNAFCKGMVFPFDFIDFAEKVAKNYVVKDIWGNEVDIRFVELILTGSMLKLWDSYQSIDHYLQCCADNGRGFSVTKTCELKLRNSRELNYQFIQSYDLSDDDIRELVSPTIEDITGAMCGDVAKTLLFLKGVEQNENVYANTDEPFIKAMMIDSRVIGDTYIRSKVSQLIHKRADRAKLGRIRVDGDFMVISGDPYSLCQSIFGLPVTGLLGRGEVFAWYWLDRNVNEVVCFRAPMTAHSNIRAMSIHCSDAACYWYRYMKNVLVLNSWDMATQALNGADKFLSPASAMMQ